MRWLSSEKTDSMSYICRRSQARRSTLGSQWWVAPRIPPLFGSKAVPRMERDICGKLAFSCILYTSYCSHTRQGKGDIPSRTGRSQLTKIIPVKFLIKPSPWPIEVLDCNSSGESAMNSASNAARLAAGHGGAAALSRTWPVPV